MNFNSRQLLKIAGWFFLWILLFWGFLLIGFPTETAKGWLVDRLARGFDAGVSIEELHIRWNLGIRLKGISITGPGSESGHSPADQGIGVGFRVRLDSLKVEPRLSGLISGRPDVDFSGDTSSGGHLSGSYRSGELSLSFQDISFKDVSITTLPLPSSATMNGSGRLKLVTSEGTIDTEVDGVPGGKQRLKTVGGKGPGLDGKLKVTISLPKL